MAKRPTQKTITSGFSSANMLNYNVNEVLSAFDNTLSLDGSAPNAMAADFDMNSNDILNAGDITAVNVTVTGTLTGVALSRQVDNMVVDEFTGDGSTVAYVLSSTPLTVDVVIVNVDGLAQLATSYTLSAATLTFSVAPPLSSAIQIRYFTDIALGATTSADLVSYSQGGTGHVARTVEARLRDQVSVKDFGVVGDGTDETTKLQDALNAAAGNTLVFESGKTYGFTSLSIPSSVTIVARGALFRRTVAAATWAVTINGNFIADEFVYSTPGSVAATDQGILIYGSNVTIGVLKSTVDTADYGNFALRIEGAGLVSDVSIGRVVTGKWLSHFQVFNCTRVRIGYIDLSSYTTGLYIRDTSKSQFSGGHMRTVSPTAVGSAGQNGILVESTLLTGSVNNLTFTDFVIEDSAEHAVRFGGQLTIEDIWLTRIHTRNSGAGGAGATGGSGFKVLGATSVTGEKHKRFHISDCTVLDVSTTGTGQGNFCGFDLGVVEDIYITSCYVGAKNNTYSCWLGIELISVERVSIVNTTVDKARQAFVRFNSATTSVGYIPQVKEVNISGGQFRNSTDAYALYFRGLGGIYSEIQITGVTIHGGGPAAIVRADAPTGAGSYANIQIEATHRNPASTAAGPPLQCGNRFTYRWTGPYYGSYGASALDGSTFTDTTTPNFRTRKAGAWVVL
jgi:hypothetical protein